WPSHRWATETASGIRTPPSWSATGAAGSRSCAATRSRRSGSDSHPGRLPRSRAGGCPIVATGGSGRSRACSLGRARRRARGPGLLRRPAAVAGAGGPAHLVGAGAAEVDGHGADLLGGHELQGRLLFREQVDAGLLLADAVALRARVDLRSEERRGGKGRTCSWTRRR